jgi:hypothetical protein
MWLSPTAVTYFDANTNAQIVGRVFSALIADLDTRPLAEVLGFEEGEADD